MQVIVSIVDKIAPLKEIRLRKNTQEWMDEEVLEGIRVRDKLLSKIKKTKSHTDHVNFKKARNKVFVFNKEEEEDLCCWKATQKN